jgi:Ran GTPase-activating protein (RanGAP) involved in mRNA processing and transport
MGADEFQILEGTLRCSTKIRKLDISGNSLRNQGCAEVANMLIGNKSIQRLNIDNNQINELGIVPLLYVLEQNNTLVKLSA